MGDVEKLSDAELIERIEAAMSRVAKMASEGRGPRMSVPVDFERDDDVFICDTLREAARRLRAHPAPAKADEERASEIEKQFLNEFHPHYRSTPPLRERISTALAAVRQEERERIAAYVEKQYRPYGVYLAAAIRSQP